jgi:Holliday junction DNA helicase RuvA
MIDFIEGIIDSLESEYIVVETGGIGYRLFCPNPFLFTLEERQRKRFYTHYHVREDATLLYGFPTKEERDLFRKLLDVNGIGPKGALSILASAAPEQIVYAIQQENVAFLTQFPGIGKKTAQRIILDLKDKVDGFSSNLQVAASISVERAPESADNLGEAVEALFSLGYSEGEVQRIKAALREQAQTGASVEQLVKQGLALLMRG